MTPVTKVIALWWFQTYLWKVCSSRRLFIPINETTGFVQFIFQFYLFEHCSKWNFSVFILATIEFKISHRDNIHENVWWKKNDFDTCYLEKIFANLKKKVKLYWVQQIDEPFFSNRASGWFSNVAFHFIFATFLIWLPISNTWARAIFSINCTSNVDNSSQK